MTQKKVQLGWYRAHFDSGCLEFQARHIGHARQLIKSLASEHFPGEKLYSIAPVMVSSKHQTKRKRVSSGSAKS